MVVTPTTIAGLTKADFIRLHRDLAALRLKLEREGRASPQAFTAYDRLGTSPIRVDHARHVHVAGIRALLHGLEVTLGITHQDPTRL